MKDRDFLSISQLIREKKTKAPLSILKAAACSESVVQALEILRTFSPLFEHTKTFDQANQALYELLSQEYDWLYESLPDCKVIEILTVRGEFDNLKRALNQAIHFSSQLPIYFRVSSLSAEEYRAFFEHQDPFKSNLPDYLVVPAQAALQILATGNYPLLAQRELSLAKYQRMLELSAEVGNQFITDCIRSMIDFHNVLLFLYWRVEQREMSQLEARLLPGGHTSTSYFSSGYSRPLEAAIPARYHREHSAAIVAAVADFEKNGDIRYLYYFLRYLMIQIIQKAELVEYGPEVPFGYLLEKEYGMEQIRTVLFGKEQGKSGESILRYLEFE